ncbi:MAG: hypothetical protein JSS55_00025 [Proteobacteria bacterium]|nr:hypothetical protein [Pseudomonadota bacterium]
MLWIVLALLALAVAGMMYEWSLPPEERARSRQDRKQRRPAAPPPAPHETFEEELARDPAGALARHGTPEDAERLTAQGVDLEALGYRPPQDGG